MINANQNLSFYRQFDVPVWHDHMPGYAGPLAGMQTGLMHCATKYLVTVPCDTPFLPNDLVAGLCEALQTQNADLAIAVTGNGRDRRTHPVCCLVKASLLPHLATFLESGGRKVGEWTASQKCAEAHFIDDAAFRNINTLEDLRQLEHE
jgi:molybdopterin-guanine dinucleotide biosynthesis protein A